MNAMKASSQMTLTDLQKLDETPEGRERIRVMVADLAGCVDIADHGNGLFCKRPRPSDGELSIYPVPHYTTSLDAIAECEAGLTDEEMALYCDILVKVVAYDDSFRLPSICAYAPHRAIAYILTKTKGDE